MFSHWEITFDKFASRVLYQLPAHYVPEASLQQNVQDRDFPAVESVKSHLKLTSRSSKRNVVSFDGLPLLKSKIILSGLP